MAHHDGVVVSWIHVVTYVVYGCDGVCGPSVWKIVNKCFIEKVCNEEYGFWKDSLRFYFPYFYQLSKKQS